MSENTIILIVIVGGFVLWRVIRKIIRDARITNHVEDIMREEMNGFSDEEKENFAENIITGMYGEKTKEHYDNLSEEDKKKLRDAVKESIEKKLED